MKYLPTINLWDNKITEAIQSGRLKLQCGQWVQCGSGPKSRYVKWTGKSHWALHFPDACNKDKMRVLYSGG